MGWLHEDDPLLVRPVVRRLLRAIEAHEERYPPSPRVREAQEQTAACQRLMVAAGEIGTPSWHPGGREKAPGVLLVDGLTVTQWAKRLAVSRSAVYYRLQHFGHPAAES